MPTFGGDGLSLAAWEQREANAVAIADWVVASDLTGVHNDWEDHDGEGGREGERESVV